MSEGQQTRGPAPAGKKTSYSPDYWDVVINQLRRRPAVIMSLGVLAFLYAIAIYAPLLANDRPLYFRGIDRASYAKAQDEVGRIATELHRFLAAGPEAAERAIQKRITARGQLRKKSNDTGVESAIDAARRDIDAIEYRLATMRRQLAAGDAVLLDEAREAIENLRRLTVDDLFSADSVASATALVAITESVRQKLTAAGPGEPPTAGRSVTLVPYRSFPVLENLSRGDVFFMVLWAFVLPWPLLDRLFNRLVFDGDRERIRAARSKKLIALFALPALVALLWPGERDAFYVSPYKVGLTNGDIVAERVLFAPIPYGLAESHVAEDFRPPTWRPDSKIDDRGFYTLGPRAGSFDEATGIPKSGDPVDVRYAERPNNSALRHVLGADSLGRDLLARIIWGARVSLAVGLVSTFILVLIGTIVGSIAGYFGGRIDTLLSRIIEIVQCFPVFFLILIVVAFVGPSILNIMLAIGFIRWTGVARLVRGEFIRLRGQDFVVAGQALGASNTRLIFRHVLPNAMGPVLVAATFSVASGILTESALSFLGFGIQLPIPSWGSLLIESRQPQHWWIQIFPGLLIFVTVMLYNLLGEGVRDALDPRTKVIG